jgi:hypothetical protein
MGIIIRKNDLGEYFLESITHSPINLTPFTKPEAIHDFSYTITRGKLIDLDGLEIDKEYSELDSYKDFEIVERIEKVVHDNGLIYDDLIFKYKNV